MNTDKLIKLRKMHDGLYTDRLKMLADLERCNETERRILNDGLVTDTVVGEIVKARGLKELVLHRLPDQEALIKKLDLEIKAELHVCADQLGKAVRGAVEAKRAEIEEALRPFFDGAVRKLRKTVESLQCPAINEIRPPPCFFDVGFCPNPELDFWAKNAGRFLDHVARVKRQLDIAEE